jgi:hypothetical protein
MRYLLPLLVVAVLVASCFMPWMTIETKGITITGVDTTGTDYGKPAYFHFLWIVLFLLFLVINHVWSRRAAMVFAAFNIAWAFRNFLVLPICQMGECPVRRAGLYLLLVTSILLFFAGLLAPAKEKEEPTNNLTTTPENPQTPNT